MKSKIYRIFEPDSPPEITGKGEKGLLIAIHSKDKQENISTLQGLVKAIKLDIEEDVTIVSSYGESTPVNALISSNNYNTVILIGLTPDQVGFSLQAKKYFIYKMESFSLLLVDSLQEMNADKSKKMAFWQNLQALFLS